MKRFKLQSGHVIKVDDCDAYLMRAYVWHGTLSNKISGNIRVSHGTNGVSSNWLHYTIKPPSPGKIITFRDGDCLNFCRDNLIETTRSALSRQVIYQTYDEQKAL
jgi:hypothetical protein